MTDSGYAPCAPLPSLLQCPDDMPPEEGTGGAGGEPVGVEEWASLAAADAEQEIIPAHTGAVLSAPAVLAAVVYAASVAQVRVVFRHSFNCVCDSESIPHWMRMVYDEGRCEGGALVAAGEQQEQGKGLILPCRTRRRDFSVWFGIS